MITEQTTLGELATILDRFDQVKVAYRRFGWRVKITDDDKEVTAGSSLLSEAIRAAVEEME